MILNLNLSYIALSTALAAAPYAMGAIIASESFNYTPGALAAQGTTEGGFNGAWSTNVANAPAKKWDVGAAGLSMPGVTSSGNSAVFSQTSAGRGDIYATRTLSATVPSTGSIYGSFLFSVTQRSTVDNVQFGIVLGTTTDGDSSASYFYSGDAYGTQFPQAKAEGAVATGPTAVTQSQTYVYLFQANATTGNTMAWILTSAQYATISGLDGGLVAANLNAAPLGNGDSQIVFKANTTAGVAIGPINAVRLLGYSRPEATGGGPGTNGYESYVDEFRISDSSLVEAATLIPEPSFALLGALGGMVFLRRNRRA